MDGGWDRDRHHAYRRGDDREERDRDGPSPRVKVEAEETIACRGHEGRLIGKGGATIVRLRRETGARIEIAKGSGSCVVSGSAEQVAAGAAAVRRIIADGDGRGLGPGRMHQPEHEETIPCAGLEGRIIGKGGATINKLHADTGARINIDKGSGECVVSGTVAQVMAAVAAVRRVMEEGNGVGGSGRKREEEEMPPSRPVGEEEEEEGEGEPKPPPIEPDFGVSGLLAAETNTVNGVTLVYTEPPEARKPVVRWRMYVFKSGELQGDPLYVHRQSYFLFGRERKVVDVPTDHPSCSKQHAVLQYRARDEEGGGDAVSDGSQLHQWHLPQRQKDRTAAVLRTA